MDIRTVGVIGAGTMGHGIAQVAALAGYDVILHDTDPAALERALIKVRKNLEGGVARGKVTADQREAALARLAVEAAFAPAVGGVDLVVEAIVEDLGIKERLFRDLGAATKATALLASNTSSLPIARMAAASGRPGQVVGLHFFNPVHIMKLLEVVVHPECADSTREAALEVARTLGKEPIVVQDSPGFASSRLGVVLGLEAMRMVEQGVASAADIDTAMTLGYGHPMGPLRLTDLVGLDVRLAIAEYLHRELGGDQYAPPEILRSMVAEGRLGKKTGRGFHVWED